MRIYSVYDMKAKAYGKPFYAQQKGVALRSFSDAANDPQTELCKHPEDFALYEIGTWDELTGKIQPHNEPDSIGLAAEFKQEK